MRNRAKCKLCNNIIESLTIHDYITCTCGEISIDGGNTYRRCRAKNWNNFLRIDDEGNEINIKVVEKEESKELPIPIPKPTYDELLDMLQEMINKFEILPDNAMYSPVTHYDHYSLMLLLCALFKTKM